LAREKNDRNSRPLDPLLELSYERVAVELWEAGVGEDEIRRERLDFGERVESVGGRGHAVARLLEADFEHAHTPRIRVDEEQFLLGQGLRPRAW
jgi:hypothetical protein